ncbi:hypothetical protein [Streptomyces sp. 8L]|uniref:hypothetical protein n=1 Tax=Streptomyces sp. 8L TaxID=2877242 RepID=UPI001CD3C9AB|nr:hypothetical protein [Streptomyces sp. 8L]MCA1218678.1 hypothetical protein [Streptomyces sp. 8L]
MSAEPETQHDRAPEITGPVREYLAVILDALNPPAPARLDDPTFRWLTRDRISTVCTSIRGLLADDDRNMGDVTFDVGWLRKQIEHTPISYEIGSTPDTTGGGQ